MPIIEQRKIVFVEDDAATLGALINCGTSAGFRCRGFPTAEDFFEGLEWMDVFHCVVVDYRLPGMSGEDLIRQLKSAGSHAHVPVIVLSGHSDVPSAVRCVKLGARDFLLKPVDTDTLLSALNMAIEATSGPSGGSAPSRDKSIGALTARQRHILKLVGAGMTSKEVAAKLGISPRTVETHRSMLMRQLNARSTADLVRISIDYAHVIDLDRAR